MNKRDGLFLLLISFFSLFVLLDFFAPGFPITHDGRDHIARIANFFQNLQEGVIVPRWAGNLNWGYGHPILMFLYPLPSYIASLFYFLGFSLIDSTKLVFIITYILSGIAMYVWIKEFMGRYPGLIASLLYLIAPYRFVDLYVRGAIGEHTAFIFPPLILLCLLKIQKKTSIIYLILGAILLAGLILSHNAISLMFLPVIGIYILFLSWQKKWDKRIILNSLVVIIFGFGLSAFFWIPALIEGKYTLRDIVTTKDYTQRFVELKELFFGSWSYGGTNFLSKQVGVIHLLFVLCGIGVFIKSVKNKKYDIFLFISLTIFSVSLFMMTIFSKSIWDSISLIQKFQFPWRFLSVSVFMTSVIGGIVMCRVAKKLLLPLSILIIALLLFINKDYWHAQGYLMHPESFYTSIYRSTTDTGESSPIWSVRFMEKSPKSSIEIIDGQATITQLERRNVRHLYNIDASVETRIRENTLYFPGWTVLIDKKPVQIEFQDPLHRGLMTFYVPKGKHTIDVIFKNTKMRSAANSISIISFLLLCSWGILVNRKYGFNHNRARNI